MSHNQTHILIFMVEAGMVNEQINLLLPLCNCIIIFCHYQPLLTSIEQHSSNIQHRYYPSLATIMNHDFSVDHSYYCGRSYSPFTSTCNKALLVKLLVIND